MDFKMSKKMKITRNSCKSLLDLPKDLLILVLKRLPLKQILVCMFTSKCLGSIIRDADFLEDYCTKNPCCLITSTKNKHVENGNIRSVHRSFYYSDGHLEFFNMLNLSSNDIKNKLGKIMLYGEITEIINGFVCGYFKNCVLLVNVFTGEVTDLPSPNIHPNIKARYCFVHDPVNHVYKLLCEKGIGNPRDELFILTIGGNNKDFSWRRIPHYHAHLVCRGMFVNGTLYMLVKDYNTAQFKILAFNPTTEKFRSFVPKSANCPIFYTGYLAQVKGKLSMLSYFRESLFVYTLEMVDNNAHDEESIYANTIPCEFEGRIIPVGNLLTGELLLADLKIASGLTSFYVYSHENDRALSIANGKFPDGLEFGSQICVVEQNTKLLDALFSRYSPKVLKK